MKTIYLHGILRDKYGEKLVWQVDSPRDALRGMMVQLPEFRQELSQGMFQIVLGDRETGIALGADDLDFRAPDEFHYHVIPVPEGAGGGGGRSKGIGTIIVGAIIVIAAVVGAVFTGGATLVALGAALPGMLGAAGLTYGSVALVGLALVMAGITALMTPKIKTPKYSARESPEERASFLFQSGSVNISEQGGGIPIILGRYKAGSVSVSAGIRVEQIEIT